MRVALAIFASLALVALVSAQEPFAPCNSCHDDLAKAFASNPHALSAEKGAQVCQSCHGDGSQHAASGDPGLIEVPKGASGASQCLSCHGAGEGFVHPQGNAHLRAAVTCDACHAVHGARERELLKAQPEQLCAPCHRNVAGQFRKPFAHKLERRGAMECVSCHNPHGGSGPSSLKQSRTGETVCVSCHVDKRGPFAFEHGAAAVGSCTTCHQPHGSGNPKQLVRAQVDRLCLECHSGVGNPGLGSQPPSFHDLRSPRYRNCTTCHVAIHGSNSSPLFLR
jgi:DmsE family decaheme c-type cytochrome